MGNFDNAANMGFDIQMKFINDRMNILGITRYQLSKLIDVSESTLSNNFRRKTEMSHLTFLKICGALDLNPYLVPKELNQDDFQRIYFN